MLFVETKTSDHSVDNATRLLLLEKLQEKGLVPLIRSTRLSCYEMTLPGLKADRVRQMERAIAAWAETEGDSSYVRGDLFCFEDYVLFLIFGDAEDDLAGVRAGIVHGIETTDPLRKLDAFCRDVRRALDAARGIEGAVVEGSAQDLGEWRLREPCVPASLARFATAHEGDLSTTGPHEQSVVERLRAVEVLEDAEVRRFLRHIREAHADGRVSELLVSNSAKSEPATGALIEKLVGAGLLRREVLVVCRKTERALFRLPSTEALSVITASGAVCSECGLSVADEKAEELLAPTERAATLLEDGLWLASRLHSVLINLGIPENQISISPSTGQREAHMMVHLCGETFLFVLRDGDWTAAHARRTLNMEIEMGASHVVVITTGKIQEEGRVRLREHARRYSRNGNEVEVILVEGVGAAITELHYAFERVSQRALAEELCVLDASLGLSVGHMLATRFQLMQRAGAIKDISTAAGAAAGSLGGG